MDGEGVARWSGVGGNREERRARERGRGPVRGPGPPGGRSGCRGGGAAATARRRGRGAAEGRSGSEFGLGVVGPARGGSLDGNGFGAVVSGRTRGCLRRRGGGDGAEGRSREPGGGEPGSGVLGSAPPRTEEKPRSREAPGLQERGRRSSRRSPSRQVVFGQPAVQVTKRPMFSAPNALAGGVPSPVRSSSPSASQVQVKLTSIVWVQSFVS